MSTINTRLSALAWFTPAHHGQWGATSHTNESSTSSPSTWCKPSPDLNAADAASDIIGKPVRYFQRMPAEARYSLCATSLALKASAPTCDASDIGLLAGRFEGCQAADMAYYQDYLASGRTLARGNMFVYTLPTSVLGAVSVVFELQGPSFFLQADQQPLQGLVEQASFFIAAQQAQAMLILWSDAQAAVCLAVTADDASAASDAHAQRLQTAWQKLLLDDAQGRPVTPLSLADQLQQLQTQVAGS